ncbi:hypothetical protein A3N58_07385 [Klebsiella aerogenes]|nr:hypothetical protein A3N58_07385 [Klebsiella aerogenes]
MDCSPSKKYPLKSGGRVISADKNKNSPYDLSHFTDGVDDINIMKMNSYTPARNDYSFIIFITFDVRNSLIKRIDNRIIILFLPV